MTTPESAPIITPEEALKLALEALDAPLTDIAEKNFKTIVMAIEARHGLNQKEVAGELQRISKEIEALGRMEAAMEFKQRSTEMMLKLGMERRRRDRPEATSTNLPVTAPSLTLTKRPAPISPMNATSPTSAQSAFVPTRQNASATANNLQSMRAPGEVPNFDRLVYFVHTTSSFEADLNFYAKVAGAKVEWAHDSGGKKCRALKMNKEPVILLIESDTLPRVLPVYAVNDLERATVQLIEHGYSEKEKLMTPRGMATIFRPATGMTIGIIR
ncbi:MAG: hypothetical protein IPP97_25935 [Candidatus Obscuribacter sp.]|jgi:hypothetical protein|nr:hypothetical protein [Candidatus Obscuribacter sp.]MBL0189169.1 hypothetical protein [Candidatus Obscuribacter sp.]MBP6351093.1 hypothetical protein [Candidatus Obscuribacter sp.]MBP6594345.1 hypothetical protein [Candidatus Obscuribacter sp.]MBP7576854.1 hypothetical protein [Candidatus Obscuribacter sp.]